MTPRSRKPSLPTPLVRPAGRALVLAFACACLASVASAPARADLFIDIQNFTTLPGNTGSFDVVLVNNDPISYNVGSDIVEVAISGPTGAKFTDATTATGMPYIYVTSFADFLGTPLYASVTDTDLTVIDSEFAVPFYRVVGSGESYGLAHVSFLDDPLAPLTSAMISIVPDGTSISDDLNNIIYPPPPSVPEPSSLICVTIGGLVGIGRAYRLRRRKQNPA